MNRAGLVLNVGAMPPTDETADPLDPAEPAARLSRILAHTLRRVPGVRRVEAKLEGKDARSGLMADVASLGARLYTLNEPVIKAAFRAAREERRQQNPPSAETAAANGHGEPSPANLEVHP